jgi:hypothetical protein
MNYSIKKGFSCSFEVYDKDNNSCVDCGSPSVIKAGKQYFCKDHAAFAMMTMRSTDTFTGEWDKKNTPTAETFLKMALNG